MELDKRIIEGKKPLDCFDTEIAKQFIGKKGYFTNSLGRYLVLKNTWNGTLDEIQSDLEQCFYDCESEGYFQYFLPAEWVKEPEKKYRAFSLSEWINQHEIGDVIHYRSKSGEIELRQMYAGTRHSQGIKNIIVKITLGNESHTLDYLFENYEIEVNGEWHPFGVKD